MLKEVLGIEKISHKRIEEVMFLSELEKKMSSSESDVSVSNDAKEKNEEEKPTKKNLMEQQKNSIQKMMLCCSLMMRIQFYSMT